MSGIKVFLISILFVALVSLACGTATQTPSRLSPYEVPTVSYAEIASAIENSTDLQWEEYVKKTVGKRFNYSGRIVSVNENLSVEIYNDEDNSTVVISNVPHDIAITLYQGQGIEGVGIITNIYNNGFMNDRAALNVEFYNGSFIPLPSPTPWETIECSDITKAHDMLTDTQWEEYVQSAQGQSIHFSGDISGLWPDGRVFYYDHSCDSTIYLFNVPESIVSQHSEGQLVEGYGTLKNVSTWISISIEINVDPDSLIIR